ncbi:MAG: hypothetical protein RL217_1701 [Pseudomonadota bacterium]|jgi:thiol:disulfide interchange protein DsbA
MRLKLVSWLAALAVVFSFSTQAAPYSEGNGYTLLKTPVAVMADGKVHVEEAFWYGCPHCFQLEGAVSAWRQKLPADVEFTGVPALFGRAWVSHAQFYYVADSLGVLDKVHEPIFRAIHVENQHLLSKSDQRDFLQEKAGVAPADFDKAYESFTVKSRMKQADARIRAFGINGVPAMIVQGKYLVDSSSAGGNANMLKVVDFLIEQERKALKK